MIDKAYESLGKKEIHKDLPEERVMPFKTHDCIAPWKT